MVQDQQKLAKKKQFNDTYLKPHYLTFFSFLVNSFQIMFTKLLINATVSKPEHYANFQINSNRKFILE